MIKKFNKIAVFAALFIALVASSCKKQEVVDPGTARVRMINTVLSGSAQDFHQEEVKLTNSPIVYDQFTPYVNVFAGYSFLWMADEGSKKANAMIDPVLQRDKDHTLFYYSTIDGKTQITGVANETKAPSANKFWVRFVNLSVAFESKNLNIVNGAGLGINTNLAFGELPTYIELPVSDVIKVNIKDSQSVTTIPTGIFEAGKTYLIWFDTEDAENVKYHIVPEA